MRQLFRFVLIMGTAVFLDCSQVDQLKNVALSDINAGCFNAAIDKYEKLIRIENDKPIHFNNLGWAYLKNENLKQADNFLNQALALNPDTRLLSMINVNLRLTRAFQISSDLLTKADYKTALDTLLIITSKYHIKEIGYKYLALCYEGSEQPEPARENWEQIISLYINSDVRNHYYLLARGKMISIAGERILEGDFEDALDIFRLLLTVEKENQALWNSLAFVLFRSEKWKKAIKILEAAETKASSGIVKDSIKTNLFMVTTFLAGDYSLQEKDFESALVEFEKVTTRYEVTDMGLKYLALCYEGLNRHDLANKCWQKIIDMYEGVDFINNYKKTKYENQYYQLAIKKLSK